MNLYRYLAILFIFSSTCFFSLFAQSVIFDDSNPNLMIISNDSYYEIAFRKSNGSIAYITDKTTGGKVCYGSRHECLWGATFDSAVNNYIGGCSYSANGLFKFEYNWSAQENKLILKYIPPQNTVKKVEATVEVVASELNWFDMRIEAVNKWGVDLEYLDFPSELLFKRGEINEALIPVLPGVILKKSFFLQNRSYTRKYPGYPGVFADYLSLYLTGGRINVYGIHVQGTSKPIVAGFIRDYQSGQGDYYYSHYYGLRIPDGITWRSPWIRFRISASYEETIKGYRENNGIDKFTSIRTKLGSRYDSVIRSVIMKMDMEKLNIPFLRCDTAMFQYLPVPSILHPAGYQDGGFNASSPDFLPTDRRFGSTAEFKNMIAAAHTRGLLVMPYINHTWWDKYSPTVRNLSGGISISDIASIDSNKNVRTESYGGHTGYVICPYSPFAINRIYQLMQQMTGEISSDLIFEDQVGARQWNFDFNKNSPTRTSYVDGWIQHTRRHQGRRLMTEMGFDLLAETEAGFHGTVRVAESRGQTDIWWGKGNWREYPASSMMLRDKVLLYQHDLDPYSLTGTIEMLLHNIEFGYMLSYEPELDGTDRSWLDMIGGVQKYILSRYAEGLMTGYSILSQNIRISTFDDYRVTVNLDSDNGYEVSDHVVASPGFIVKNDTGTYIAGIFSYYNGERLSGSEHLLIEERSDDEIILRHPAGIDTEISIRLSDNYRGNKGNVRIEAHDPVGKLIKIVRFTRIHSKITFFLKREIDGNRIEYYRIYLTYPNED